MNTRIALTGPMYSGKSTIAEALEREGFVRVVFTDLLKRVAMDMLHSVGLDPAGDGIMGANKKKYRPFLQELGALIGFNNNPKWVYRSLEGWAAPDPVVFDNVRTVEQWAVLKGYDFTLVRVEVPDWVQSARAQAAGVGLEELQRVRNHPIEQGVGLVPDLVLDGTKDPKTNVRFLIGEKEYSSVEGVA